MNSSLGQEQALQLEIGGSKRIMGGHIVWIYRDRFFQALYASIKVILRQKAQALDVFVARAPGALRSNFETVASELEAT